MLFLAAQTALLWWVAARDRTTEAHFAWTTTVVAPPAASPPAPVVLAATPPATTRPSCPPPRTDAATRKRNLPTGVNHVTTSVTNAGWLAAWDEHRVLVSTDGGISFTQMLDGPGTVNDVTFDCFGHPIVSRGDKLGIRDGTREMWRTVSGLRFEDYAYPLLIGGGPDIVIAGSEVNDESHTLLAISSDLGATWWFKDTGVYWDSTRAVGRQDANGTIHIAFTTADCMSDPTTWVRVTPDGTLASDDLGDIGRIGLYGDIAIATYGDTGGVGWKRFGEKQWHEVKGLADTDHTRVELVDGPLARIVSNGVIYTVDARGNAKALRPWPYGTASVDRAGQLWGIDETKDGEDAWLVAVPGTKAPIPPPSEWNGNE
ncbi:MAG TPA: hypothetical protein VMZ53_10750 [Kofleriaceae bacterium]|nr:hypothetical protein [Kofleriaceae bacterium]